MKKNKQLLFIAPVAGILIAIVYELFINLVEKIQNFIWFDLGKSNENSLMAIPLSVIGGLCIAGTIHLLTKRGHVEYGHAISDLAKAPGINLGWVIRTLFIGFVSLVAGASLGPEAILIPVAYGIGFILAKKAGIDEGSRSFGGLIGVIALLSAFFNSYFAGLVPLALILSRKSKKPKDILSGLFVGILATASVLITLRLLNNTEGYIHTPDFGELQFFLSHIVLAAFVSAICMFIPVFLSKITVPLKKGFGFLPKKWYWQGLVAGLVLGILYASLGSMAFFSGKEGISELLKMVGNISSSQLLWLGIGKIIVTSWCLVTVYRGGLVFPQLFAGLSLILILTSTNTTDPWIAMLMASSFFGIFTGTLGSLLISAAFVLPLFGIEILPVLIASALGAAFVKYIFRGTFSKVSEL